MNVTTQSQIQSHTNLSKMPTSNNSLTAATNSSSSSMHCSTNGKHMLQDNSRAMKTPQPSSTPLPARSPSPDGSQDYDVTRMREEDFERLAVYIVPDVHCEKGLVNRADKTLPRSLTLKPSMVFSAPNVKVSNCHLFNKLPHAILIVMTFQTEGVWSTGVIPRGTRFGPFEGMPTPHYPNDPNTARYFWRVSTQQAAINGLTNIF